MAVVDSFSAEPRRKSYRGPNQRTHTPGFASLENARSGERFGKVDRRRNAADRRSGPTEPRGLWRRGATYDPFSEGHGYTRPSATGRRAGDYARYQNRKAETVKAQDAAQVATRSVLGAAFEASAVTPKAAERLTLTGPKRRDSQAAREDVLLARELAEVISKLGDINESTIRASINRLLTALSAVTRRIEERENNA